MQPKHEGVFDYGREEAAAGLEQKESKLWLPSQISTKWTFDFSQPAFIAKLTSRKSNARPTAWLDGLRGFAAFLVYWHHHQLWAHDISLQTSIYENSFGYNDKYYAVAFPILRTFFSGGHLAVSVFFVISGYVLTMKGLSQIHNGEQAKLADSVGSALFRRWLRLYIPVYATTLIYLTTWHLFGIWSYANKAERTYFDEILKWYRAIKNYSFLFNNDVMFEYNFHVWSVPMEFRGSIIVYTAVLAFSRLRRDARLWSEIALIFYFMYIADGWFGAMFISGMLLCDLDLLASKNDLPRILAMFSNFKELIFFHLFLISLYLGGVPSHSRDLVFLQQSPGWVWLSWFKPQAVFDLKWFYLFWAAMLLVASVPRIPWLKYFFETRACQYLGRISFSLYLVHGPIIWILGERVYAAVGWTRDTQKEHIAGWMDAFPLSKAGPLGLEPAFILPHIILLPFTLWVAEIATRLIDEPSVRVTNWLYRYVIESPDSKPPLKVEKA